MKRCSTTVIIREMQKTPKQNKTKTPYNKIVLCTLFTSKNLIGKDRLMGTPTACEDVNWHDHFDQQFSITYFQDCILYVPAFIRYIPRGTLAPIYQYTYIIMFMATLLLKQQQQPNNKSKKQQFGYLNCFIFIQWNTT